MSSTLKASALAALLSTALVADLAGASPLEDPSIGGAPFTGVTSAHPTSLFINPAALGLSGGGGHYYLGGSLRISQLAVDRQLVDVSTGEPFSGPSVSANAFTPSGMLAAYWQVSDRGHAGLAVGLPFSEQFVSGSDQLAYHSQGGGFRQYQLTGGGAIQLGGKLHLGLGASLGVTQFSIHLARDTALEAGTAGISSDCGGAPCSIENPMARQEIGVDVGTKGINGFFDIPRNVGLTLGLLYELSPRGWRVAFSFVAPPGTFAKLPLRGNATAIDAPRDGGTARSGEAEVNVQLPFSVHLGASGPIDDSLNLLVGLRWLNLSTQRELDIRMFGPQLEAGDVPEWYPRFRGFRDTVQLTAGIERQRDFQIRWGTRLIFDTGAVPADRITPIQVEPFNVTAAGGVELRFLNNWVASFGYALSWYPRRSATPNEFDPTDRIRCVDSMFDVDACGPAREGRATPSAAGDYTRFEHGLLAAIRWDSL